MKNEMTVSKETTLIGELRSNSKIKLEGRIEGSGIINNTLLISSGAVWVGNIIADTVIVDGAVKGNIVAKHKLLLLSNAKVFGSLYSKNIHVDNGAAVTGKIQMDSPAPLELINDPSSYALKATVLESPVLNPPVLDTSLLENDTLESEPISESRKLAYSEVGVV